MTIVAKADGQTAFAEYLGPHNTTHDIGKTYWYAQTFPLPANARVFRTAFKVCVEDALDPWYFRIRATDGAGKPTGPDLHVIDWSSANDPVCGYARPQFTPADFNFPQFAAGQYALILSRPGSVAANRAKIHAYTTPAPYTLGKAWRSTDSGATWTEIATTTLNFAVYGYIPPPDPPPADVIGNWLITDHQQTLTGTGYIIVVTTNTPCHMWMRWTTIEPQQHMHTAVERGADVNKYLDQCLVAYSDIQQNEMGDTLTHTFTCEPWPTCQTRYWYYFATRLLQLMPSSSPIFSKHRTAPTTRIIRVYSYINCYQWQRARYTWAQCYTWPDGVMGQVSAFARDLFTWYTYPTLTRAAMYFSLIDLTPGKTIVSATLHTALSAPKPANGTLTWYADYQHILDFPNRTWPPVITDYAKIRLCNNIIFSRWWPAPDLNKYVYDTPLPQHTIDTMIPGQIFALCTRLGYDVNNVDPGFRKINSGTFYRTWDTERVYIDVEQET